MRKVGHPEHSEYAIGAVTPRGGLVLRDAEGLSPETVAAAVARASQESDALHKRLHAEHPALDPMGKTVVLADDGLATGTTMTAAVRWARRAGAGRIIVAVPVGPQDTVSALEDEADEVICPVRPGLFMAVGVWYERFAQVSDEEVLALLAVAAERRGKHLAATRGLEET